MELLGGLSNASSLVTQNAAAAAAAEEERSPSPAAGLPSIDDGEGGGGGVRARRKLRLPLHSQKKVKKVQDTKLLDFVNTPFFLAKQPVARRCRRVPQRAKSDSESKSDSKSILAVKNSSKSKF